MMDTMFFTCKEVFDQSPLPFGIAKLVLNENGDPTGFTYEYLNPAMASLTEQTVEELIGTNPYVTYSNNDPTWVNYFYEAAYHGISADFEAVTIVLESFEHVAVFPINREGYCGFLIQNIVSWFHPTHIAMANVSAGLFFYDMKSRLILLTPPARELTGMKTAYMSFVDFAEHIFGGAKNNDIRQKMLRFRNGETNNLLYESQRPNGQWVRLSLAHLGSVDQFVFGIIEDITRLKDAEVASERHTELLVKQTKALQSALDVANHASEAKSTFLTNMSHDFRTPMNAITGFTNIAMNNLDNPERVKDCLNKILISSEHLLNLVNDILDVSRVESGRLSLVKESVSLVDMCHEIDVLFTDQAAERGVAFHVDSTGLAHPNVKADKLRLNQILVNVVGNAIKFTPPGGSVSLRMGEAEESPKNYQVYVIEVSDTGCGMPPEFMDLLFVPFERLNNGSFAKAEGTGLGMTITKSLVDMMSGTIDVESAVDVGTTFTIRIPLKTSEAQAQLLSNHERQFRADAMNFRGKRALVADDDELSREILSEALSRHGFEVDEVEDGDIAVATFASSPPFYYDVVIMDLRMPNMNGDEAARRIRALQRDDGVSLPIIAATADAFEEIRKRTREAGMDAHITKPLDISKLIAVLADCLKPE